MNIWIVYDKITHRIDRLFDNREKALNYVQTQVNEPNLSVMGPFWVER